MEENINTAESTSKMSFLQKIILIFTNPTKVFENLKIYPDWILPTIIIIVLSIVSNNLLYDMIVDSEIEKLNNNTELSDAERDARMEGTKQFFNSPIGPIFIGVVMPIVIGFIAVFFMAAIFLLTGNFIMGGQSNYKSMLALSSWGFLISLPETVVKIPLILSKGSIQVYTSLAVLFDTDQAETVLFKIADAIDLFVFWRVAVWAIGFGVMYNFTKNKAVSAVVGLTLLYFVIKIGVGSLF